MLIIVFVVFIVFPLSFSWQVLSLLGGEVAGVVFPLGDEGGHVGREVAVEVHLLAGLGVDKTEGLGVQGLAGAQLKAVVDELGIAG